MNITDAKYTDHSDILAVINGQEVLVPDDMANRHRAEIARWEAAGNKIAAYEPPPPPPATKVSKARVSLFLYRYDAANGTALKATMEQVIASDPEAQILYDSVVDLELNRGGTRTIWDAVRAQTGTVLTVEEVFESAAALTI